MNGRPSTTGWSAGNDHPLIHSEFLKYLLDSHAVVRAMYSPDKFSPLATTRLSDATNEFLDSHVTVQELLNKVRRGELPIAGISVSGVFALIQRISDGFPPVTLDHILAAANQPPSQAADEVLRRLPLSTGAFLFQS